MIKRRTSAPIALLCAASLCASGCFFLRAQGGGGVSGAFGSARFFTGGHRLAFNGSLTALRASKSAPPGWSSRGEDRWRIAPDDDRGTVILVRVREGELVVTWAHQDSASDATRATIRRWVRELLVAAAEATTTTPLNAQPESTATP